MARTASLIAAAALIGSAAAPAAAQYPYPQPYPQPYSQPYSQPYPQPYAQPYAQPYPQQGYPAYPNQPYGQDQGTIGAIIDSLIGNRYNVSDRQAIRQCAFAAVQRAQGQFAGGYPQNRPGYGNGMRVTAITDVQRRSGSVRVRGLLGAGGYGNRPYNQGYGGPGYGGPGYGGQGYGGPGYVRGDVGFRCDVDYRGYVRNVRLEPVNRGY